MERYEYTGGIGRAHTVRMEPRTWCAVPTNAFDNNTVTHLFVSKQAFPVPAVVAEVVEALECWGRAVDLQ